ncbi:hypothetical protein [Kitasatospora sp. NPDC005856]|uniref:hypothetical protein n=1 Tax=Kitasatospora sp. NPDC005856 TaxID=3154566 RepID=UPI0033DF4DBB
MSNGEVRRPPARRLRALLSLLVLAAAALLAGPVPSAAAAATEAEVYYIGDDGGLWSYQYSDTAGSWSAAARRGPAALAPPGARVAAVRVPGHRPVVYFAATDGSLYEYCADYPASAPFSISAAATAEPGGRITAAWAGTRLTLVTGAWTGSTTAATPASPAAAPTTAAPAAAAQFNDACLPMTVDWRQLPAPAYPSSEAASFAVSDRAGIFTIGDTGGVTVGWTSQATGGMTTYSVAPAGSARPGGGIAVAPGTTSGTVSVFFAGRDGRLNRATVTTGAGRIGSLQANTTAPAGSVPDGAVVSAARNAAGTAVGYVATDGSITLAHLSSAGLWQSTEAVSATGFSNPGSSVAISDVDGYPACGTNGPRVVHFGPVRGPSPDPWVTAGLNATLGAAMTFA